MRKLIFVFSIVFAFTSFSAASAASTKAPAKAVVTKKVASKKTVKKVTVSKYGTAKNPVFIPTEAAKAMGTSTTDSMLAYQNALRAAQKLCIAAGKDKVKLAACDQAFVDAQALLGQ